MPAMSDTNMTLQQQDTDAQNRSLRFGIGFSTAAFGFIAWAVVFWGGIRIAESDLWFHLRNADQLLTEQTFLRTDLYTFTSAGAPLINHEWLSEIPYYLMFRQWGLQGVLGVYAILLLLIYASVYYRCLQRNATTLVALLGTLLAIALGFYSFGPRMMHFGWLCMSLLFLILDRYARTGRSLWILPPLFMFWINCHGSWVFGFIVMGTVIGSGLVGGRWQRIEARKWTPAELRKLIGAAAASFLALFLNPYGYRLVLYPFDLLVRQGPNVANVIEWQSVNFSNGFGKLLLFTILALLVTGWTSPRLWKLSDALLILFSVCVATAHKHFLFFAGMTLVPLLVEHVPNAAANPKGTRNWFNTVLLAGSIGLCWVAFPTASALDERVHTQFPRGALTFIREHNLRGRLFHDYDFGGYIEWYAPEIRTFADGRTDIFVYNHVFDDYLAFRNVKKPLEILEKYRIDYVLLSTSQSATRVIEQSQEWRIIYSDKLVKLFERVRA